jgi:hypothetical protein
MSTKLLERALSSPNNLRFADMVKLAESFGYRDPEAAITSLFTVKSENYSTFKRSEVKLNRIRLVSS